MPAEVKVILDIDLHDDKEKKKAMKAVSGLEGISSINMDMNSKKMTVVGVADPVNIVSKLRKCWPHTKINSVGPAKEPPKKEEAKKKEEPKKADDGKSKDDDKKKVEELLKMYQQHHNQMITHYNAYNRSCEEDPNGCVIC